MNFRVKEPFSSLSHLAGAALAVAGLVFMLIWSDGKPWSIVSASIYGGSLILLYLASGIYHLAPVAPKIERRLQKMDHAAIYLLIAGSYVPVCLISLRGPWGWTLFGIEYGLAAIGVLATIFWTRQPPWFRVVLYILMGWLAVIAMAPLAQALAPEAIFWLVVGGVIYTIGAAIFALDRPHLWPGRFSAHDLWHVFVLGGSVCHFIVVAKYILPPA